MKESEIRQLFLKISNRYSSFAYDDFKVNDWLELLSDVSFEQAKENLRQYCLNPDNTFPPHPGALAATTIQKAEGPYVPNAEETRRMLDEMEQLRLKSGTSTGIPQSARERMKALGFPRSTAAGTAGSDSSQDA